MTAIFVYGLLKNYTDAKQEAWVSGYRLIDLGYFPAAIPDNIDYDSKLGLFNKHIICGQLIYVDKETLHNFDILEGCPNFYYRQVINIEVPSGDTTEIVLGQMYCLTNRFWHLRNWCRQTSKLTTTNKGLDIYYEYQTK